MAVDNRSERRLRAVPDAAEVYGQPPPHNLDTEAAVLSAMIVDASTIDRVTFLRRDEDGGSKFFSEANGRIFDAILAVRDRRDPVDIVTVMNELHMRERLKQVGGLGYVTEILNACPSLAHVEAYAKTVYENWRARRLIAKCQTIAAEGYFDHGEHGPWITAAAREIADIDRLGIEERSASTAEDLRALLREMHEHTEAVRAGERDTLMTGIPTGLRSYDYLTNGLHGRQLTIVGALPGVGKTAMAMQWAMHAAERGVGVAFFQMDNMSAREMRVRALASLANITAKRIWPPTMTDHETTLLVRAANTFSAWPIEIHEGELDVDQFASRAAVFAKERIVVRDGTGKEKSRSPLGLIVVDYVQKFKPRPNELRMKKHEYLVEAAKGIGRVAKELGVPVVGLAQLTREFEREHSEPEFRHIADCSEFAKEAQNIAFITDDSGASKSQGGKWEPKSRQPAPEVKDDGARTLFLRKQRGGKRGGVIKLRFDADYTRFREEGDTATRAWPEQERRDWHEEQEQ